MRHSVLPFDEPHAPRELSLLAALATEEPPLLVSDHGAAKMLLLVALANALGLTLRHYNASILQFDDLIGFPMPNSSGATRYAAPPGATREAKVPFSDEIGRCRPGAASAHPRAAHEGAVLPRRQGCAAQGVGDLTAHGAVLPGSPIARPVGPRINRSVIVRPTYATSLISMPISSTTQIVCEIGPHAMPCDVRRNATRSVLSMLSRN
jgi:hypothetical protein